MTFRSPIPTNYQSTLSQKVTDLQQRIIDTTAFEGQSETFLNSLDTELLQPFRAEYAKILKIIRKSKANCESLILKSEDVKAEISSHEHLPTDISKLSEDQATLKTLKTQISRAEVMLTTSSKREDTAKDELRQARWEVANLNATIKGGVGLSTSQEKAINELVAIKDQTTKDLESELEKIVALRGGLTSVSTQIDQMEQDRKTIDKETHLLKEKNAAKKLEIDMELAHKEKLERDMRELRVLVTIKNQEAVAKQTAVNRSTEDILTIEGQIKTQKSQIEKLLRDQQDYDDQMVLTSELMSQNEVAMADLKVKERELNNHRSEVKKVNRIKDALVKKSRALEEEKLMEENERRVFRTENEGLSTQIDHRRRAVDTIKKTIDDLEREKDLLKSGMKKTQSESTKISSGLMLQKQQEATLDLDIARMLKEAAENGREVIVLTAEKTSLAEQSTSLAQQSIQLLTDLRTQELKIFDFKRTTFQAETKLKYQQSLYEGVQSDRKLHAKLLIDSQGEIGEMKRKLKIMNFQINGFKEEVNSKDVVMARESGELVKLAKDADLIRDELKTLKSQTELASAYIKSQLTEELKLDRFVKEVAVEQTRQTEAVRIVGDEREGILGLVRERDSELSGVYDRIKTQNQALRRDEDGYRDTLRRIRNLRLAISEKRGGVAEMGSDEGEVGRLRRDIVKFESLVLEGRMQVTALEDELRRPINVHRWRTLEGTHPQLSAALALLHTLQKTLIANNKKEKGREAAISIKEGLYLHMKNELARQTGMEGRNQVEEFEKVVRGKGIQLGHMETELNMYKAQVQEYTYAITGLDVGLKGCKKRFLAMYKDRVNGKETNGSVKADTIEPPARTESVIDEIGESENGERAEEFGILTEEGSQDGELESEIDEDPRPMADIAEMGGEETLDVEKMKEAEIKAIQEILIDEQLEISQEVVEIANVPSEVAVEGQVAPQVEVKNDTDVSSPDQVM